MDVKPVNHCIQVVDINTLLFSVSTIRTSSQSLRNSSNIFLNLNKNKIVQISMTTLLERIVSRLLFA